MRNRNPQQSKRPIKPTLLIVTEGKTEKNYLESFRNDIQLQRWVNCEIKCANGGNAEHIFSEAKKLNDREEFDEVHLVLDVEGSTNVAALKSVFETAMKLNFNLYLSNPAFEVWFHFHFEANPAFFYDANSLKTKLVAHWKEHCGKEYEKADKEHYACLRTLHDVALMNWEKRHSGEGTDDCLSQNPCTTIPRLLLRLKSALQPQN